MEPRLKHRLKSAPRLVCVFEDRRSHSRCRMVDIDALCSNDTRAKASKANEVNVMNPNTRTLQTDSTRPLLLLAGAAGVAAGIASWAYRRRERSRWDGVRKQAGQLVKHAREDVRPWMGVAVGTAAAGAALAAYARDRRKSGWQRAGQTATETFSQAGRRLRPWAGVAASAAISLASAIYNQKARTKAKNAMRTGAAKGADSLADTGLRILRGVRYISEKTGKLYPKLRKRIA